jgi:hypothetical protein
MHSETLDDDTLILLFFLRLECAEGVYYKALVNALKHLLHVCAADLLVEIGDAGDATNASYASHQN